MATSGFAPRCADFKTRVRDSFACQPMMRTLAAQLDMVAPGNVDISMPYDANFTQQHGFLHGGTVAAVLDTACGYSGLSLMDAESAVLSAEFKINFLAPADGARFRFEGRVVKAGRTLVPTEGKAFAVSEEGTPKLIATMSCTVMAVRDRGLSG